VFVLLTALVSCGEPAIDLEIPERADGQSVLDQAGILEGSDVAETLDGLQDAGLDVVALTYETPQATCGEAYRAGGELIEAWDVDVAVVAVARPGEFTSTDDDRRRCIGVRPQDEATVSGSLRERIAEEIVVEPAGRNDWPEAFRAAIRALAEEAG
jgi:hypothetical protein